MIILIVLMTLCMLVACTLGAKRAERELEALEGQVAALQLKHLLRVLQDGRAVLVRRQALLAQKRALLKRQLENA